MNSPLQFHRDSLATLRQTLLDTGLPAEQLALELTEGILMDNTDAAINILNELHTMQVSVRLMTLVLATKFELSQALADQHDQN